MTNKIDLPSIFDVYSIREQTAGDTGKGLTPGFKNRVWQFCEEMVPPYDHHSLAGYKIADFWMTLRDKLRYRHGLDHLADRNRYNPVEEVKNFLSECSDEHYLDFIEMFFRSEQLPMYFSDGDLRDAVNNINTFFDLDELPYVLTEFSVSESQMLGSRVERPPSHLRPQLKGPELPGIISSHTQPLALPIRIAKIEAFPKIIRRDSQMLHETAIVPVLNLLTAPAFREANKEFLEALGDYSQGDYRDCLTKCGSAYESVMKIICEQKGWPPQKDAAKLLDTVLSRTSLPKLLKQPLIQTNIIRNELGSAHGAGPERKKVSKHLTQYTVNVTASAILLLVEETEQ